MMAHGHDHNRLVGDTIDQGIGKTPNQAASVARQRHRTCPRELLKALERHLDFVEQFIADADTELVVSMRGLEKLAPRSGKK
jgi:hypothetical protein